MDKDIVFVGIDNALLQEGERFPIKGSGKVLNGLGQGHFGSPEYFSRSL